jgi:hypothetical protein
VSERVTLERRIPTACPLCEVGSKVRGLLVASTLLVALLVGATPSHAQNRGSKTTVTGYLRDSFCFIVSGVKGPSHKYCATACAEKGIPVLLVESAASTSYQLDRAGKSYLMRSRKNHKVYVLLPPADLESLPQDLIDKMEEEVTLTGEAFEKEGTNFLRVEAMQP